MSNLNLVLCNVQGWGDGGKQERFFDLLSGLRGDLAIWTETHIEQDKFNNLQHRKNASFFLAMAPGNGSSSGVIIAARKSKIHSMEPVAAHPDGRFLQVRI